MKGFLRFLAVVMCGYALLQAIPAFSQVTQAWVKYYNGPNSYNDIVTGLAIDHDGNVIVTGGSQGDYMTIKYNPDGDTLWTAREVNGECANAVTVDSAGNVYVTGLAPGAWPNYSDIVTFKYTPDGDILWGTPYSGPAISSADEPAAIVVDDSGYVYVVGKAVFGTGSDNIITIKYEADGTFSPTWPDNGGGIGVRNYHGPGLTGYNFGRAIAVDNDGNVYVTGESASGESGSDFDYATIKYSATGSELWANRYNGTGNYHDTPVALAVDDSGNVYVAGTSFGTGPGLYAYDYATVKYDNNGSEVWVARYNGPGNSQDHCHALCLDDSGNVYVTGGAVVTSNSFDYTTVKYSSAGAQVWVASNDYGAGAGNDVACAITRDDLGYVYVTGTIQTVFFSQKNATVKYNAAGQEQWAISFNGGENLDDRACGIALDQSGNVFVSGTSETAAFGDNWATVKYTQAPTPMVTVTLTPVNPPIQIPRNGGSFNYNISVANTGTSPSTFDAWIMVQLPNFSWYGPVLGPINLTLPSGVTLTRQRTQNVPGSAPTGLYTYRAYVGTYSAVKWDSSSFTFTKLATGDGSWIGDWANSGESFEAWMAPTSDVLPEAFNLEQNYPNPFNPTTVASYELRVPNHVSLRVYDTAGRLVSTLVEGWREAGSHEVTFDGSNLPSGIYFCRLQAGEYTGAQKMALIK